MGTGAVAGLPRVTRSVVVRAPGEVLVEERAVPVPEPDEILVRVGAAGICGSDVELVAGTRPAAYVRYPVVPGHEWAGTVAATGETVADVSVGDRVVAQGFRHCGRCSRCREGATNLCEAGYAETGFTHPGGFSGYLAVPARLAHVLPTGADLEAAALLEPSACVVEGLRALPTVTGARVAVVGTGTLSLVACQILAAAQPEELVLIGDSPGGRELGTRFGATRCVGTDEAGTDGWTCGADVVFEAAGRTASARIALAAARRGGTVVLEGIPEARAEGDLTDTALKHLTVRGIFGASAAAWQQSVALFSAGLLDLRPLISHRFSVADVEAALATLDVRPRGLHKVLLMPDDRGR